MLAFDAIAKATPANDPFRHIITDGVIAPAAAAALAADFPDIAKTGFFPLDTFRAGPQFQALLDQLSGGEFAAAIGAKLDLDLSQRPVLITVRKWSAAKDGRVHTDGADKVASALIYLNHDWPDAAGCLRFLAGPDLDGPGTPPIVPRFGTLIAFPRRDNSWHGHHPFAGERRVVQIAWLQDGDALARKQRRHRTTGLLKSWWPFGRTPAA